MSNTNYFAHESSYVDDGCEIGEGTKIWHFCHVMSKSKIGKNCNLGQNVFVASKVVLGDQVKVQNNVSIYEGVICENNVFLGPSMVFTNVYNPRSGVERKHEYRKTIVKIGASIGANATIVCGNNIPPYALVVGNPARQIGWMSEYGEKLEFDMNGIATCEGSGEKYQLKENIVVKIS